jgi:ABC-2 type transport system permease protein
MATATRTVPAEIAGGRAYLPADRLVDDLRAVRVVWRRELIRFFRARARIVTSLVQPILYLFVLGTGLSRVAPHSASSIDFRTFLFPGILAMTVMFSAMFQAVSIVWDRELGFLREMLVAPVRRSSLVLGRCLGGATVATFQGAILLAVAGLVHVPYKPLLLLELVGALILTSFAMTAFGVMVASRIRDIQSFQTVMQLAVMPMFFLAGVLFPLSNIPGWLRVLTRLDPLTYAVDPMRRAVISSLHGEGAAVLRRLDPGVTWGGWHVPPAVQLLLIAGFSLAALSVAIVQFSRIE